LTYFYDLYGTEVSCACKGSQIFQETIKAVKGRALYYDTSSLALVTYKKTHKAQNKRRRGDACALKRKISREQGSFLGNTGFLHLVVTKSVESAPCPVVLRGNFCGPTLIPATQTTTCVNYFLKENHSF